MGVLWILNTALSLEAILCPMRYVDTLFCDFNPNMVISHADVNADVAFVQYMADFFSKIELE